MSSKKFDQKCTMLLKLAVNRIQIHRTKKTEQSNKHKKEIADLLDQGKDELARVRTISVVFEDYMVEVLNTVELYCETICARMQLLATAKTCPPELKEPVCSIIYSAPYLDIEELKKLRLGFIKKYGKKFPQDCVQNSCVNQKLVTRLQHNPPEEALVNYYLSAIAKKHNVDWELPATTTQAVPLSQVQQPVFPTPVQSYPTDTTPIHFPSPGMGSPAVQPQPFNGGNPGGGQDLSFPSTPMRMPSVPASTPSHDSTADLAARLAALSPNALSQSTQKAAPPPARPKTGDLDDELDNLWSQVGTSDKQSIPPVQHAVPMVAPNRGSDEAVAAVNNVVTDLDAAVLFAAAGQLENKDSSSYSQSEQALLEAGKALERATEELARAAESGNPDALAAASKKVAQCVVDLARLSKNTAAMIPDTAAKQELLTATKASALGAQRLIITAQQVQAKRGDAKTRMMLLEAAGKVRDSIGNLVGVCQTSSAEAAQGIKEIENAKAALAQQMRAFDTPTYPGKRGATAEDVVRAARDVAGVNAQLVMAQSQADIATGAREVVRANQALLDCTKGASALAADPNARNSLIGATKQTSRAMEVLLESVRAGKREQVSESSTNVARGVNDVVAAARLLPGGGNLTLEPRAGEDLDQVAQRELQDAARAIEAVAQQLALRPRPQPKEAGSPIDMNDISDAILESAQAIASAAGKLLTAAASAQKERVSGMQNPKTKHLYHKDPVWTDGLISAARAVVATTNHLVKTANAASTGKAQEEDVIASARAVAASTQQLVNASRVRSELLSTSHQGLENAAKAIATATSKLVQAAKQATEHQEAQKVRHQTYRLSSAQAADIEATTKILKLERELENARTDLMDMRKARYSKTQPGK